MGGVRGRSLRGKFDGRGGRWGSLWERLVGELCGLGYVVEGMWLVGIF